MSRRGQRLKLLFMLQSNQYVGPSFQRTRRPSDIRIVQTAFRFHRIDNLVKEGLIKSFDRLRTNGNYVNPFVVSSACAEPVEASNHRQIGFNQCFTK